MYADSSKYVIKELKATKYILEIKLIEHDRAFVVTLEKTSYVLFICPCVCVYFR